MTSEFYHIYKFMRRRSRFSKGVITETSEARVWPSIHRAWAEWLALGKRDPPTPSFVVVADASDSGWGSIVFNPDGSTTHWAYAHFSLSVNKEVEISKSTWPPVC